MSNTAELKIIISNHYFKLLRKVSKFKLFFTSSFFRNKKIFDFGSADPSKVEIHDGSKTYVLTKTGEDWLTADGKKYEKAGVDALISKLRDLQATDFADSGFGASALQITITSDDGKRTEKASLSKGGKNTLARREGESSLYVLDANSIEDIQKLLSDLKS